MKPVVTVTNLDLIYASLAYSQADKQNAPIDSIRQGVALQGPDRYPSFSWDYVPRYMHVRKSKAFTQQESEYLSKFPIIPLEKTTGMQTYGSTEQGSLEAAKASKAFDRNACVLYYRNVMCSYGTYLANKGLKDIPGAFWVGTSHGKKRLRK